MFVCSQIYENGAKMVEKYWGTVEQEPHQVFFFMYESVTLRKPAQTVVTLESSTAPAVARGL